MKIALLLTAAGFIGAADLRAQAPKQKVPDDRECVVSNGTTDAEGGARAMRKPGENAARRGSNWKNPNLPSRAVSRMSAAR